MAASDADLVRRLAHRIKGASLTVGAAPAAALAEQIEQYALDEDWQRIGRLCTALQGAVAEITNGMARP